MLFRTQLEQASIGLEMYLIGKDDFIILLKQAWIDTRETPKGKANFVNNVIEHKGRYSCKY